MSKTRIRKEFPLIAVIMAMLGTALFAIDHNASGRIKFARDEAQLIGNWTGDSICLVKNSPCRDEKVIYHITKGSDLNHVIVSADKIVDGKPVNMGALDYTYDRKNGSLLNETEGRIWKFIVKGNTIEGTLTLPDKTVYRRVTLKKEE